MTPVERDNKILNKQRRTRLMLEHILSQFNEKHSESHTKVHEWLERFSSPHRPGLEEWKSMPDWLSTLQWMIHSIESDWDEVERLMSNHPFSCIINQEVRSEIFKQTA